MKRKKISCGTRVEHGFTSGWRGTVTAVTRRDGDTVCTVDWDDGLTREHSADQLLIIPEGTEK